MLRPDTFLFIPRKNGITLLPGRKQVPLKIQIPISLYWKCQLAGWTAASLYWSYTGISGTYIDYGQLLVDFIGDVGVCILITHAYRTMAVKRNWQRLSLQALALRIIPAIFILGFLFMVLIAVKLYIVRISFTQNFHDPFWKYFAATRLTLFITGVRLMSIWVLAYHLYHYAQREINAVKENARLSIITKEAQINNLSAQLNPHFFFNSLNSIKFLVNENPEAARRAIDLLSDLLRNSLYGKDTRQVPLQEEINLVKDYLELEKLRFEERLQVHLVTDEKLINIAIPYLSIQTLVENAIKHGIDKRKEGGLIAVKVEQLNGCLKIGVHNSGRLVIADPYPGLGLKNLEERLQLQYNGKATLEITEVTGPCVMATILIPIA